MNQPPLTDDSLDGLLSDFFKAQMKKPWPTAPATPTAHATPRNQPALAAHDSGSRARYTLAASVALLLGTCWTLSNGFQPGERLDGGTVPAGDGVNMNSVGASEPAALLELRKDKAEKGNKANVFDPNKVDPFK